MIARFSGRSAHTVRIKNKPTPEGYKILSFCDAGYTYTFIFTSRIQTHPKIQQVSDLSKVGNEVYHLTSQLPIEDKSFNIYMDNYFSSIKLFKYLREKKIGACGTVRTNSANFPKVLKVNKKLDWDTLSGVVVNNILAILWMDNGPVTMLSTIHQIDNKNENWIERVRRRPRETSTNAAKVRAIFGTLSKKTLPIPVIIDDYNHFMGGVDIADQLRGYYGTQLPKGHYPEWRETRSSCVWCKYLVKKNQEKAAKNLPQSQLYCIKCDLALCYNKESSNCFKDFHTYREDDD
ncbi:hypothetical protein RclHR1_03010004 [Rhizophagus clarus]|uniref:PiggyBac transposable element-derived protein domain-containing protein n=1 Tax=Rhizophagus clarus TaxID=94130 RepID=A0A2Z6RLM1_9GLOM|nr:hypothetical protein RclHR1_03010004 [Rhizophagus clarus]